LPVAFERPIRSSFRWWRCPDTGSIAGASGLMTSSFRLSSAQMTRRKRARMPIMPPMSNSFITELERFGPERFYAPLSRAQAQVYCSRLARTHYENFTVASVLLPRHLIRHFHTVYAYCRWADDLADEAGGGPHALSLLRWWREELLSCYDGRPRHPVFVALQDTIRRFGIPPDPFLDLLFAFEQDQLIKRYSSFEQLRDYCRCSANPVGRLVLYLC